MKKLLVLGCVFTALTVAATSHAGFGNVMKKAAKAGANEGISRKINKDIKKYNCNRFVKNSTELSKKCDFDGLINALRKYKTSLGASGIADLRFYIKAHGPARKDKKRGIRVSAHDRSRSLRDKLYGQMSWWSYNVRAIQDDSDSFELYVESR